MIHLGSDFEIYFTIFTLNKHTWFLISHVSSLMYMMQTLPLEIPMSHGNSAKMCFKQWWPCGHLDSVIHWLTDFQNHEKFSVLKVTMLCGQASSPIKFYYQGYYYLLNLSGWGNSFFYESRHFTQQQSLVLQNVVTLYFRKYSWKCLSHHDTWCYSTTFTTLGVNKFHKVHDIQVNK